MSPRGGFIHVGGAWASTIVVVVVTNGVPRIVMSSAVFLTYRDGPFRNDNSISCLDRLSIFSNNIGRGPVLIFF